MFPQLFSRTIEQYGKLRKKAAFLEEFKKERLFESDLSEFDSSKEVVQDLIDEYQAATTVDYLNWGTKSEEEAA